MTESDKQQIISQYINGKSIPWLADKWHYSQSKIRSVVIVKLIKRRKGH